LTGNGLLDTATYGNGAVVKYEYDNYHRVIAKIVNTVLKFEFTYDNQGNLSSVIDHAGSTAVTYSYFYDFMNRLTEVVGSNSHNMLFTYDSYGRIDSLIDVVNGTSYKNEYDYGDKDVEGEIPGLIYNVKLNGTTQLTYDFDQLARLSTRTIATTSPYTTTYTYLDGSGANSTTTLLASMTNGTNAAFNYTYDANGNILTIKEGTTTKATYTYDKMNQLIREDNAYSSKSIDYVYDVGGNIVSRTEYNYTGGVRGTLIKVFNYGYSTSWKDQMTSYDGQTITYDSIGNPTAYLNGVTLGWQNGRELASYTKNSVTTNYTYNDSGIRTSKKIGTNPTINYYLNGSSIVRQTDGAKTLDFFYDENGNLYGFKEAGAMYYYLRNGQNDIIGILDNTGAQVVSYVYDSWGNLISTTGILALTIGADNPFRYRGYYFDSDTGLYYLNSRYYDSTVGRFINADGLVSAGNTLLGDNMYSYCENNPINCVDPFGSEKNWFENFCDAIVKAWNGVFNKPSKKVIKVYDITNGTDVSGVVNAGDKVVATYEFIETAIGGFKDPQIHAMNVLEVGASDSPIISAFHNKNTMGDINGYIKHCKEAYELLVLYNNIGKGKKWNDLTDEEQMNVIGSYYFWDNKFYKVNLFNAALGLTEAGYNIAH
jgi:RHS repeat-associated protein